MNFEDYVWDDQIKIAMTMLKRACEHRSRCTGECPFFDYCCNEDYTPHLWKTNMNFVEEERE